MKEDLMLIADNLKSDILDNANMDYNEKCRLIDAFIRVNHEIMSINRIKN